MSRKALSLVTVAILLAATLAPENAAAAPTPDERARALLAKMTLDEKIAMVHGGDGPYTGDVPANKRLGIPAIGLQDGPAGVGSRNTKVTAYPSPISAAAAWDPALAQRFGAAMAREVRGKGANVHLAPMINILRVPHGGRNWESLGEDPYLASVTGAAEVKGIQREGVIATPKHYAANNQENDRHFVSANVDERTLREIYYPAFEASAKAGAGAVMCSYNRINKVYACENPETLKVIREHKLWVMSDWGATHSTVKAANAGMDQEMPGGLFFGLALKAAVLSGQVPTARLDDMVFRILRSMFAAGVFDRDDYGDIDADVRSPAHTKLARDLAAQGTVLMKNTRSALPITKKNIAVIGSAGHIAPKALGGGSAAVIPPYIVTPYEGIKKRAGSSARVTYSAGDSAAGAVVPGAYLKTPDGKPGLRGEYFNNKDFSGPPVLTRDSGEIDFDWRREAPASGVNADNWSGRWTGTLTPPKTGTYTLQLASDDGSRLFIDGQQVIDNWGDHAERTVSARVPLTAGKAHKVEIRYYDSALDASLRFRWVPPGLFGDAVEAAKEADVAVVVAGLTASEGADRPDLKLPGDVDKLISEIAKVNPRTVVVLNTPGQVEMPWVNQVASIAQAWLPGQEMGNALADVLFGDMNPSGRLPATFGKKASDYPANTPKQYPGVNHETDYSEGLRVGYRHFDASGIEPLFPFGHGLSYTRFGYRGLSVSKQGRNVVAILDVRNLGSRAGTEVVQLYLGYPAAAGEPPHALKAFKRVSLKPGEKKRVTMTLTPESLQIWGNSGWTVTSGKYQVFVGASSRDFRANGSFTIP